MAMQPSLTLLAVLFAASSVSAQQYDPYFSQGYNNASGFGTRIGVGVGVAALVLAIVLVGGFLMRKRRARAFKANYPVQHLEQGQGNYPMQPQQQPGYNPSFAPQQQFQQEAPPYANYSGAPAASFNNAHNRQPDYAPPAGAPPSPNPPGEYAPPSGPPPMQQSSSYAPPIGPPPVAYDPTNVHNK